MYTCFQHVSEGKSVWLKNIDTVLVCPCSTPHQNIYLPHFTIVPKGCNFIAPLILMHQFLIALVFHFQKAISLWIGVSSRYIKVSRISWCWKRRKSKESEKSFMKSAFPEFIRSIAKDGNSEKSFAICIYH